MALGFDVKDFDLQSFLQDMRREASEGLHTLAREVKEGFEKVNGRVTEHEMFEMKNFSNQESRLRDVEKLRDDIRWFGRAVIAAIIVASVGLIFNIFTIAQHKP